MKNVALLFCGVLFASLFALAARGAAAQVSFEAAARDLANPDPAVRFRTVQLLKAAAYPEAAVPLAALLSDPQDEIQLEAIAAELNIFLAEKIVPRKRVGFLIEVRNRIAADAAFSAGPSALGPRPVPVEVLAALRAAARDDNPRVALEALYAFGTLGGETGGAARRELLGAAGPELASMLGQPEPAVRFAALRVMARLFGWRPHDEPIDEIVGDAVITALNDSDRTVSTTALQTLGAMRYERAVQAVSELFQYYGRGASAEAALDALARIAHASSAPLLVAQLTGRNAALKLIAIEGLARLGDRARTADIEAALAGERGEALLLARSFAAVLLGDGPIDAIVGALGRSRVRDLALMYLVEIAPGRTAAFSSLARDPEARIRLDVADVLGLSGDASALAIVEPMTKDGDPQVAFAAERAVARLRPSASRG